MDSRISKSGSDSVQADNGQAAVDQKAQVIVAQDLSNNASDALQLDPMVGPIKQARGFRQLLPRGLSSVKSEWSLICSVHNVLKLAKAQRGG